MLYIKEKTNTRGGIGKETKTHRLSRMGGGVLTNIKNLKTRPFSTRFPFLRSCFLFNYFARLGKVLLGFCLGSLPLCYLGRSELILLQPEILRPYSAWCRHPSYLLFSLPPGQPLSWRLSAPAEELSWKALTFPFHARPPVPGFH